MARFDRYMLSQLMVLFGFFSLVLVMVYWINRAVALFDQLIADGQSAWVFLEFTALTLPNVIRVVLPISAFVASVYVTNRLSTESELVVMQSSGFSAFRLARPVLYFGIIAVVLLSLLSHVLVPAANRVLAERQNEISRNVSSRFLSEGRFLHPAPGVTFYIRRISPAGELRDIYLSDRRDDDRALTYTARRALLVRDDEGPRLLMFDGLAQSLATEDRRLFTTSFREFVYDLSGIVGGVAPARLTPRQIGTVELLAAPSALLEKTGATARIFRIEAHERIAQPLLAVVTSLIGFACLLLGGFSRFGVWRQIVVAIVMLVAVNVLDNTIADLVRGGDGLWPLLYLPAVAGTALAAGTLWLADKPALFARARRAGREAAA